MAIFRYPLFRQVSNNDIIIISVSTTLPEHHKRQFQHYFSHFWLRWGCYFLFIIFFGLLGPRLLKKYPGGPARVLTVLYIRGTQNNCRFEGANQYCLEILKLVKDTISRSLFHSCKRVGVFLNPELT